MEYDRCQCRCRRGDGLFLIMGSVRLRVIFLLVTMLAGSAYGFGDCSTPLTEKQKTDRLLLVNAGGVGAVTAWGTLHWDYFSRRPHAQSEGWFGNGTDDGGADKWGHLYTSYVTSHGFSSLFKKWCIDHDDAALYGALSSYAIWGYMELADSFSDYGFSWEDLMMNTLGSVAGYYLYRYPGLSRKFDLRWEYHIGHTGEDITTDYDHSKYLIAMKFNGFDATRGTFLKYFELHLGYYARGFYDPLEEKERNLYLGTGVNLTDFFRERGYGKTSTFFKYMQLPYTYLPATRDLND